MTLKKYKVLGTLVDTMDILNYLMFLDMELAYPGCLRSKLCFLKHLEITGYLEHACGENLPQNCRSGTRPEENPNPENFQVCSLYEYCHDVDSVGNQSLQK